jgi:hypothetical protein
MKIKKIMQFAAIVIIAMPALTTGCATKYGFSALRPDMSLAHHLPFGGSFAAVGVKSLVPAGNAKDVLYGNPCK